MIWIIALISVLILSKELVFVNEEILVICSFLLFLTAFFNFAGESLGKSLDQQSDELVARINQLNSLQLKSLENSKIIVEKITTIDKKIIPSFSYVIDRVELIKNKFDNNVAEYIKNKYTAKLNTLLSFEIDTSLEVNLQRAEELFTRYLLSPSTSQLFETPPMSIKDNGVSKLQKTLGFVQNTSSDAASYLLVVSFLNTLVAKEIIK